MITPCAANRATNVHPHAVCNDYVTDKNGVHNGIT